MSDNSRKIAVITGDIVGSTELGSDRLERAMNALSDSAEVQANWHGESLHFTRSRGDGWQVALACPKWALRSALTFRAALRANGNEFDSYMGIALGRVPEALPDDLNDASGVVFTQSGGALDVLKQVPAGIRMDVRPEGLHSAAVVLADQISQDWTPAQAEAMLYMLDPNSSWSYTALAEMLGKSRQAVTKSLEAAHEKPLRVALAAIEQGGNEGV